jgi:hypothetical protein
MRPDASIEINRLWSASYQHSETNKKRFFRFCYIGLHRKYYARILNYVSMSLFGKAEYGRWKIRRESLLPPKPFDKRGN